MDILKCTESQDAPGSTLYGVIDIGSNTIVLIIYDSADPVHVKDYYSEPVHLVSYNIGGRMQEEGIQKAKDVLEQYRVILLAQKVSKIFAFITEPWRRLSNAQEFLSQLNECGIRIDPLSGREEAEYDFYGSRIDCSDVLTGNAVDIGGGSTELISFIDGRIHEAYSLPAGCVRLSTMPVTPEVPQQFLNDAFKAAPALLDTPSSLLIGIGGTCRACGLLAMELWPDMPITRSTVHTMLENLLKEDEETVSAMKRVITPGRWSVLAPGLNMLAQVMDAYGAETLRISEGCVREGYLLKHI